MCFQTYTAGFIRLYLFLLERGEKVLAKCASHNSIETRQSLIKEVGLFFSMGKL